MIFKMLIVYLVLLQALNSSVIDLIIVPDGNSYNVVKYKLQFQYAPRQNKALQTSSFSVYWNSKLISRIIPSNYNLIKKQFNLSSLCVGNNQLKFVGQGPSDSYGASIDNVKIVGSDNSEVNVINGDFQNPKTNGGFIKNNIPGWNGFTEIGNAAIYNSRWPKNNQVAELDANQNVSMSQIFIVDNRLKFKDIKQNPCNC